MCFVPHGLYQCTNHNLTIVGLRFCQIQLVHSTAATPLISASAGTSHSNKRKRLFSTLQFNSSSIHRHHHWQQPHPPLFLITSAAVATVASKSNSILPRAQGQRRCSSYRSFASMELSKEKISKHNQWNFILSFSGLSNKFQSQLASQNIELWNVCWLFFFGVRG